MGLFRRAKEFQPEPAKAAPSTPPASPSPPLPSGPASAANLPDAPPTGPGPLPVEPGNPPAAPVAATPSPPAPPAPAPTSPPPAANASIALPERFLNDFAEKITTLTRSADAEREAVKDFAEKVWDMEKRVEKFQMLFEALSVKYNPFLGKEEPEPFDGEWSTPDQNKPPNVTITEVGPSSDGPLSHGSPPGSGVSAAGHDGTSTSGNGNGSASGGKPPSVVSTSSAPLARPVPPTMEPPTYAPFPSGIPASGAAGPIHFQVQPAPLLGSRGAGGGPRQAPWGGAAVQGTRESYLVLSWFDYMFEQVEPLFMHGLLDYYLELGWITQDVYDWLRHLLLSIAPLPATTAGSDPASSKRPTPRQLVRLHKTNLRFFDALFRINLNPDEPARLERIVAEITRARPRKNRRGSKGIGV